MNLLSSYYIKCLFFIILVITNSIIGFRLRKKMHNKIILAVSFYLLIILVFVAFFTIPFERLIGFNSIYAADNYYRPKNKIEKIFKYKDGSYVFSCNYEINICDLAYYRKKNNKWYNMYPLKNTIGKKNDYTKYGLLLSINKGYDKKNNIKYIYIQNSELATKGKKITDNFNSKTYNKKSGKGIMTYDEYKEKNSTASKKEYIDYVNKIDKYAMVKSMTIIFLDYNIDEKEYYINYGDKKIYPFK